MTREAHLPALGARVEAGGTFFGVYTDAPSCSVRWYDDSGKTLGQRALAPQGDGHFGAHVPGVGHGALYRFVIRDRELPDPYARFLPHGVHGPAMVVEPRYDWRHGVSTSPLAEQVFYELHVGTFSEAGTYAGAMARLQALVELGVTTVELMPVAAFDGTRGWGYDGVAHFAPFAPYGTPDELRAFVDAAHGLGLGVVLDVVYNHFGPSGNYLGAYSDEYFTHDKASPWGDGPNFGHAAMRRYVLENARYWLDDFRFDGLRLDATHAIHDPSPTHVLRELADRVASLGPKRFLIAEDDRNDESLVTRLGLDALWADDFHHQVRVTLTGERDGYYANYEPGTRALAQTIERGFTYEGQVYPTTGKPRGTNAGGLRAENLVYCIQNHDQVGNRPFGERLTAAVSLDAYLTASLLLLFLPMVPLLFMGQEWGASTPFLYFTDHEPELGRLVTEGRRREFAGFSGFRDDAASTIPDPQELATFVRSRLDWTEREGAEHARVLEFYRNALRLRRTDPVLRDASRERLRAEAHGDVLVARRWHDREQRLLACNFGRNAVMLRDIEEKSRICDASILLSTAPHGDAAVLEPNTAVLLAGTASP